MSFKIGDFYLDKGKTLIVAEIGSNHGGSADHALELMKASKVAGADCVKFQSFIAEELYSKTDSWCKRLKKLELKYEDYLKINKYSKKIKVPFFSTCTNLISLNWLKKLKIPAYKIASTNLNCHFLLKKAAEIGKPVIISTGMSLENEIREAVKIIEKTGNKKIVILHCISAYPASVNDANLKYITRLKKMFPYPIGFSDHTADSRVSALAVALGASVIEKHITIKRRKSLPDSSFSLFPEEFSEFAKQIRETENILGSPRKIITPEERESRKSFSRGLYARIDIKKGEIITEKHIKAVRPKSGMGAEQYCDVIGAISKKDISSETVLKKNDFVKKWK